MFLQCLFVWYTGGYSLDGYGIGSDTTKGKITVSGHHRLALTSYNKRLQCDKTHYFNGSFKSYFLNAQIGSPFEMARPYDLLAFLNQDTRWENIHTLYHDLLKRQIDIDTLWTEATKYSDVNNQMTRNKSCQKIGSVDRLDWYTSHLEDGTSKRISGKEFKLTKPGPGQDTEVPDCKKISSLTYSMSAYEHLEVSCWICLLVRQCIFL